MESYQYTFDKNDNILTETLINNMPTSNDDKINQVRTYEYDANDRLVNSHIQGHETQSNIVSNTRYSYDIMGNITGENKDGLSTTNEYNGFNQLTKSSEIGPNGYNTNKVYKYDNYGNQIKETKTLGSGNTSQEVKNFKYDVDNRLTEYSQQISGISPVTQINSYNGEGQRIGKSEGDDTIRYYYQGNAVLYTEDGQNNTTALNLLGLSENTIATARGTGQSEQYYFYNNDGRDSTTNLVSSTGQSMVSYDYTDFGETTINGDEDFYNEICYTGGIYDKTTGLYYLNARYYNPEDARFLTQDTYRGEQEDPATLHLYAYCHNNPIKYTDPTGNWVWAVLGAAWGAYDGYKYAQKHGLSWKTAAYIAAQVALGIVPIGKLGKFGKLGKKFLNQFKKSKSSKFMKTVQGKHGTYKTGRVKHVSRGKGGCFIAGTTVSTSSGQMPIEQIRTGDHVWAEDPATGERNLKEVLDTYVREKDSLIELTIDGEVTKTTEEHPYWVEDKGFIPAGDLKAGDVVKTKDGELLTVNAVDIVLLKTPVLVYNLNVEGYHTYYVSEDEVLVHNMCAQPKKPKNLNDKKSKKTPARSNGPIITKKEAETILLDRGFKKTNYLSDGQPVFQKGNKYATRDKDGHNGGAFKMATSLKKLGSRNSRLGTYDKNLNRIGD